MRIFFLLAFGALVMISCKQKKGGGNVETKADTLIKKMADSLLITDSSWGGINASTDMDGLKSLYGVANIKDDWEMPEGIDSVAVTRVYPDSSAEFRIYWQDSFYHKKISSVKCYSNEAVYHTDKGIKIGTTLRELEKINGKPISFYGFGWDEEGGLSSLNHGALDHTGLGFRLSISGVEDKDVGPITTDGILSSDMPAVKKVQDKITVAALFHLFKQ